MGPGQKHLCMLKRALELDAPLISNMIGVDMVPRDMVPSEVKSVAQFFICNSSHTEILLRPQLTASRTPSHTLHRMFF